MISFITREEEINNTIPLQVLYFFYLDMPFHSKILLLLSEMEEKYNRNMCFAVNVESFPSQCIRFSITCAPSLLFIKDGVEVKRLISCIKKQDITDVFSDILWHVN